MLRLVALIAGLVCVMWAVHWYFFQLPAGAMPARVSASPPVGAPR